MNLENAVDSAIAALLSTVPGLKVVIGMQDNEPALTLPYCVVHSNVQGYVGNKPIYELLTTIEYVSISGQDAAADVDAALSAIDRLLTTTRLDTVLWQGITKSQADVGDRRKNIRELKTFAQPVAA